MIPQDAGSGNTIPVPKNSKFSGPCADSLAKLAFLLMLKTSSQDEYRKGFFIPSGSQWWHDKFGGKDSAVKKAARSCEVFEFNDRYSNFQGNCFCQSIRLAAPFRTGETELYELSRKLRTSSQLRPTDLPSKILVSHFKKFWLPELPPEFDNPWQAFCWARIYGRQFYASRCEFGRFHSNFTAFKHRYCLQYDAPLVALDIVACQMLILGAVACNALGMSPDLQRWFDLCKTGQIYGHFADRLQTTRQEAKNGLIRCVFERPGVMTAMNVYRALEREFGAIAAFLVSAKSGGHQTVAHLCQRMESSILIGSVVPKLAKIPMITVHDEFIVAAEAATMVKDIIEKEFMSQGMRPTFKIKEIA